METAPGKIKKMAVKKESENWEFRSFLKGCDLPSEEIDSIVHRLYRKIASEIDCKTCANCCKEVQPTLDSEDIEKFSKGLGISIALFKIKYLIKNNESQEYIFNQKPCPFLKAKLCSCYTYRPKDCISYPHLHKTGFTSRSINIIGNCSICPIVFNVYECLKNEIWYDDDFEEFNDFY
jgi:Fe-S-cluster containining protein